MAAENNENKVFCCACLQDVDPNTHLCSLTLDDLVEMEQTDHIGNLQQYQLYSTDEPQKTNNLEELQGGNNSSVGKPEFHVQTTTETSIASITSKNTSISPQMLGENNTGVQRLQNIEYLNNISVHKEDYGLHYDPSAASNSKSIPSLETNLGLHHPDYSNYEAFRNVGQQQFGFQSVHQHSNERIEFQQENSQLQGVGYMENDPRVYHPNLQHSYSSYGPYARNIHRNMGVESCPQYPQTLPNDLQDMVSKTHAIMGNEIPMKREIELPRQNQCSTTHLVPKAEIQEDYESDFSTSQFPLNYSFREFTQDTQKTNSEGSTLRYPSNFVFQNEDRNTMYKSVQQKNTKQNIANKSAQQKTANIYAQHRKTGQITQQKNTDKNFRHKISDKDAPQRNAYKGSQQVDAYKGSQQVDAYRGVQYMDGNKGAQYMDANKGAQYMDANKGAQYMDANKGAQYMDANKGSQYMNTNKDVRQINANEYAQKEHREKPKLPEKLEHYNQANRSIKEIELVDVENSARKKAETSAQKETPEITQKEKAKKLAQKVNAEKMAQKENAEKMAQKENAEKMAQKENAEKMTQKEKAEKMTQKEKAEKMAQKENAAKMAQKENAEKMAQKENAEKMSQKEIAEKMAQKENAEKLAQKENAEKKVQKRKNAEKKAQNKDAERSFQEENAEKSAEQENLNVFTGKGYDSIEDFIKALNDGTLYKRS